MALRHLARRVFGWTTLVLTLGGACPSDALPPGFSQTPVASGWNEAVGLAFAPDNRMFVWEKGGRVWTVEGGVKGPQPLIDIHDEVGNWRDFGLLGFCPDPDFYSNGYVYLLYVVDYEHLKYYGTPDYDPNADWYYRDTIARLTRYTANAGDGFHSVDPNSRRVLIGESMSTGFPICHQSHGIGTVAFGEEGSLLVGCGDGASYEEVDNGGPRDGSSNTALQDGIIRPKEDVGAFRAQLVDCLNGKIIRIDPATGDGLPGNPFFDAGEPRAPRSRVWAMGLRNPFRWTIRPGTGDPHTGRPGTVYIGDVGWYSWEELNIAQGPGINFGWPIFEGMDVMSDYYNAAPFNQDAPNPLSGENGCAPYFRFRDLITQETLNTPSWPNPCDAGVQVPAELPTFENTRPPIDWGHGGPSRVKTWSGGNATWALLGAPDGIPGAQFAGNCSVGGAWYTAGDFPAAYKNTYFAGDYGQRWIRNFVFDDADNPVEVREFAADGEAGYLVALAAAPAGGLYTIAFDDFGNSNVWRIAYTGDLPPVVKAKADPAYGPVPLTVHFRGSESHDPEGGDLQFQWDFGDGKASKLADPVHIFKFPQNAPTRRDVSLTVTDPAGMKSKAALIVSLNNTPPVVSITSPVDGSLYSMDGNTLVDLGADISDAEQGPEGLACTWRTILHHNDHTHPEPPVADCQTQSVVSPVGCNGETYYYEFRLTVADDAGLETTRSVFMYPDCCAPDINGDGTLDLFDFLGFTNLFNTQNPRADCQADGVFDLFDFLCFVNEFNIGC